MDTLQAMSDAKNETKIIQGDYIIFRLKYHFGAQWDYKIETKRARENNTMLEYLGYSKEEDFANSATVTADLALLF